MEKLKNKTFYTIYGLLSLFLIIVVFLFNFQNYNREVMSVKDKLYRVDKFIFFDKIPLQKPNNRFNENMKNRLIMDYQVYTLLLDNNNEIIDIINHSDNTLKSDIKSIGNEFIKKNNEGLVINNLYFSNYSYNYKSGEYLIIFDNSNIKERLISSLISSSVILFIYELVMFFASKYLTKWITKPAVDSYDKQKNFIIDASHELKTPLSIIMASADALESDKFEKKWLDNIKSESERMNILVKSLLDLSKLENNIDKKMYTDESISKLIEKSALIFESVAFENKVEIETNIEGNINYLCNKNEITELMSILLDNAIKHSKKNSKVIINLYKTKKEINIEVINKGEEIPKDECEKIFERFYRLDKSRNRDSNRYGIGLAIAKTIVLNHNGRINAFSKDGFTTFKVVFKEY